MISKKLETLVEAANMNQIHSKYKAITAFFPYAVWQHGPLRAFLRAVRSSKQHGFMWNHIRPLIPMLLNEESHLSLKQAAILASPHSQWWKASTSEHSIQLFAAAASAIPYTDEVGMSLVDTLLQVASDDSVRSFIPVGMWSWLNKRPSLPPVCWGRRLASSRDVFQIIRTLGDIETLTSFLLLVWSEWDELPFEGLEEMRASILEDLGGIEMWRHREDLLRHLNHILGRLDSGLEHLRQHDPDIDEGDIQRRKDQYGTLRGALLEVDMEAAEMLLREALRLTILFCPLIPIDRHKVPLDVYVCNSSPVSVAACPGCLLPVDQLRYPSIRDSFHDRVTYHPLVSFIAGIARFDLVHGVGVITLHLPIYGPGIDVL